jgi:hypothetical protein
METKTSLTEDEIAKSLERAINGCKEHGGQEVCFLNNLTIRQCEYMNKQEAVKLEVDPTTKSPHCISYNECKLYKK